MSCLLPFNCKLSCRIRLFAPNYQTSPIQTSGGRIGVTFNVKVNPTDGVRTYNSFTCTYFPGLQTLLTTPQKMFNLGSNNHYSQRFFRKTRIGKWLSQKTVGVGVNLAMRPTGDEINFGSNALVDIQPFFIPS